MTQKKLERVESLHGSVSALNELKWKLKGLGHFISNIDDQAAPNHDEYFGMGLVIVSLAKEVELVLSQLERLESE